MFHVPSCLNLLRPSPDVAEINRLVHCSKRRLLFRLIFEFPMIVPGFRRSSSVYDTVKSRSSLIADQFSTCSLHRGLASARLGSFALISFPMKQHATPPGCLHTPKNPNTIRCRTCMRKSMIQEIRFPSKCRAKRNVIRSCMIVWSPHPLLGGALHGGEGSWEFVMTSFPPYIAQEFFLNSSSSCSLPCTSRSWYLID